MLFFVLMTRFQRQDNSGEQGVGSVGKIWTTEDRGRRTDTGIRLLSSVFCPLIYYNSNTPLSLLKSILPICRRCAFGALILSNAFTHPQGYSNIDLYLPPDSLVLSVDLNKDDIVSYSLWQTKAYYEMNDEELADLNDRIAHYLQNRLLIEYDGTRNTEMRKIIWSTDPSNPTRNMDTTDLIQKNLVFRLAWPRPETAVELKLTVLLFSELPFEPVSRVRLYLKGYLAVEEHLTLDDSFTLDLRPDSLEALARLAEERSKPPRPPFWKSSPFIITFIVLVLLLVLALVFRLYPVKAKK
jgi:hypothetical protein